MSRREIGAGLEEQGGLLRSSSERVAEIRERLAAVEDRIEAAARRASRRRDEIRLIAVSKRFPVSDILAAVQAGAEEFGESRPQELDEKYEELVREGLVVPPMHMIGHLQRNKVKLVVGRSPLIHSVDSLRLAQAISRQALDQSVVQPVLLQVNISDEDQKHGFAVSEIEGAMNQVAGMEGIVVVGLMGMASLEVDSARTRPQFALLRQVRDRIQHVNGGRVVELSMGMSGDYEEAIEEGATLIRVGSAIFGDR
ncbi:MAG: YggS family pyridoxal phosphate-dependent enzyme [Bacteroidetes bacterium]|nr:YggS family pyridoxal phosphate-dependent enzyme [Bacteroidota bacterium]